MVSFSMEYIASCPECGESYKGKDSRRWIEFTNKHMLCSVKIPCPNCGNQLSYKSRPAACPKCGAK